MWKEPTSKKRTLNIRWVDLKMSNNNKEENNYTPLFSCLSAHLLPSKKSMIDCTISGIPDWGLSLSPSICFRYLLSSSLFLRPSLFICISIVPCHVASALAISSERILRQRCPCCWQKWIKNKQFDQIVLQLFWVNYIIVKRMIDHSVWAHIFQLFPVHFNIACW